MAEEEIQIQEEAPAAAPAAPARKRGAAIADWFFHHGEKVALALVLAACAAYLVAKVLPGGSAADQAHKVGRLQAKLSERNPNLDQERDQLRALLQQPGVRDHWRPLDATGLRGSPWMSCIRTRIIAEPQTGPPTPRNQWIPASASITAEARIGAVVLSIELNEHRERTLDPMWDPSSNQRVQVTEKPDPTEAIAIQRRKIAADGSQGDWENLKELRAPAPPPPDPRQPRPPEQQPPPAPEVPRQYTDAAVEPKTTYEYRARARGRQSGSWGDWSAPVSVRTPGIFEIALRYVRPDAATGSLAAQFRVVIHLPDQTTVYRDFLQRAGDRIGCEPCQPLNPNHEHHTMHRPQGSQEARNFDTGATVRTIEPFEGTIPYRVCPNGRHDAPGVREQPYKGHRVIWVDDEGGEHTEYYPSPPQDRLCPDHGGAVDEQIRREAQRESQGQERPQGGPPPRRPEGQSARPESTRQPR